MKSKKIIESLEKIKPDEISKRRMLHTIQSMNNSKEKVVKMKKNTLQILVPVALVAALLMTNGIPKLMDNNSSLLYSKGNVMVNYIDKAPEVPVDPMAITAIFSEDEVFNMFKTDKFMGTVKAVKNVKIDFNGSISYRAIATVIVEKSYEGAAKVGDEVELLLPGPVDAGQIIGADFNIQPAMKAGERGIFMPIRHDESSKWEENGTVLDLREIAQYGIIDTQRFVFLETKEGLVFVRETFPQIKDAKTLEEIEAYISEKIK
ncbi:MAG: hypothetical protein WBI17_00120 [Clostridiaceae bacterium]